MSRSAALVQQLLRLAGPRSVWRYLAALPAVLCLALSACSKEPEVKVKTPDEVRAEIRKVENDPKMPPNVKNMVLGLLRRELAQAEKHAKQGK